MVGGFITIMFVPQDHGKSYNLIIPSFLLALLIALFVAVGGTSAYFAVDYKYKMAEINALKDLSTTDSSAEDIERMENEITNLKRDIERLKKLEADLRELTNLRMNSDFSPVLPGLGGPSPSDQRLAEIVDYAVGEKNLLDEIHSMQEEVVERRNNFYRFIEHFEENNKILASRPSVRPAMGFFASGFGYRVSPFTGREEFHTGVDIANSYGSKVVATADGMVTFAGTLGTYGKLIAIRHTYGYETRYAHLSEIAVKRWQEVKRGQVIGYVGGTGTATGPHVHYEVILGGKRVNPYLYFME
ncbi:MAG: peptidoglycan DD-metalloendopeptidase family protein [bacterium]